jgi:NDP-sugar pyrophosphorylase family protein
VTGVVLAGTHSSGQSSLDKLGPRALLPLAGQPLLAHALDWLAHPGVDDVVICANGASQTLKDGLARAGFSSNARFRDDVPPRGPAGSAADVAAESKTDLVVVLDCSTIPAIDLTALLDAHRASEAAATVVAQPPSLDAVHVYKAEVPVGIYVFDRRAFAHVPAFGFQDIKEGLLRQLARARESIEIYHASHCCPRVFDTRSYLHVGLWAVERACLHAAGPLIHASSRVSEGALLIGPVLVGAGAEIRDGATIVGPAVIGEDTIVHGHAVVSRAVVGSTCVIGESALVDRSVILDRSAIEGRTRISDAFWRPSRNSAPLRVAARERPTVALAGAGSLPKAQPDARIDDLASAGQR